MSDWSCDLRKPLLLLNQKNVKENRKTVEALLNKWGHTNYVLVNLANGTRIRAANQSQQLDIIKQLKKSNKEFYSHPPSDVKMKRFVLYGLNSDHSNEMITADLDKYGVKPEKVARMTIKKQRYTDQATILVYYNHKSQIDLSILKQASFICKNEVKWANYVTNGDGVTICDRCFNFGHSDYHCNLDPRCGFCSGPHPSSQCPLLLAKRSAGFDKIDTRLLKCPNCGEHHTAKSQLCQKKKEYMNNMHRETTRRPRATFIDAATPKLNMWKQHEQFPELGPQYRRPPRRLITSELSTNYNRQSNSKPHSNNHNNMAPSSSANNDNPLQFNNNSFDSNYNASDKYNPKQIFTIFKKVIECIEICQTKKQQIDTMMDILTEYYI